MIAEYDLVLLQYCSSLSANAYWSAQLAAPSVANEAFWRQGG